MLLQLTLAALAALSVAPCVLQRLCPSRPPRPPSSVCMHRVPTKYTPPALLLYPPYIEKIYAGIKRDPKRSGHFKVSEKYIGRPLPHLKCGQRRHDTARGGEVAEQPQHPHPPPPCPSPWAQQRAMPVHLAPAAALAALILIITTHKALDKEGRSLLRAQWEACGAGAVGAQDGAELKRRAYCALRRCKLLAKDGKLRKAALTHLARGLPADQTKILERCSNQSGDTPEDLAWNIFTCAFEHKSLLNLPPSAADVPGEDTSRLTD
ncbi:hypothetical protein RR48_02949 [Papilio machaon]|uniref:Uncharacterized protein n=1 Tax=Papilio machaon TaxID=76193 RepID=A0A0N0PBI4_PAPMA|nr:hypothetical protein RR48_02949 [Papilio machaon]